MTKIKNNKKIFFTLGVVALFVGLSIYFFFKDTFFKSKTQEDNISTSNLDKKTIKRLNFALKLSEDIYKMKPDLVVSYNTIEFFGNNCKITELIFKRLNLSNKITKENYKENIEKFYKSEFAKKYSEHLLRAIIMLHHSIKTHTYPKANGKMSEDIFKPLEELKS